MENASFIVEPEAPAVAVGEQVHLIARTDLELSGDLEWEVQEQYGGGLLRSQGAAVTYVAPEFAGTYHLKLSAARPTGRRLHQTVEIRVLPCPSLDPASVRVAPGGSVLFVARMKGLPKETVRWSVEETGGGEFAENGRYTAPLKPGTYHVTAISTFDPKVRVSAEVGVGDH